MLDGKLPEKRRRRHLQEPSAHGLRPVRPARLQDRRSRGGHVALPAAVLPRAPGRAGPRSCPLLARGRRERLDRFFDVGQARRPTLLPEARAPAARPLHVPAVGQADPQRLPGPDPGHEQPAAASATASSPSTTSSACCCRSPSWTVSSARMFTRMRENGTFDQALIVVTADHGLAFEVGVKDRRTVTRGNIDEIAPVPLFVKAPGQRRGTHRAARTCARSTSCPRWPTCSTSSMPYRADGRSAFSRSVRRRRFVRMIKRNFSGTITVSARTDGGAAGAPTCARSCACSAPALSPPLHGHRAEPLAARPHAPPTSSPPAQGSVRATVERRGRHAHRAPRLAAAAHPGRRARSGRQARSQARHRRGRERADRGGRAHLLPARQQAGELRGEWCPRRRCGPGATPSRSSRSRRGKPTLIGRA